MPILFWFLFASTELSAQSINTIAGIGTHTGTTFDSGIALECEFHTLAGIAFDHHGNIIFSDEFNYKLRKLSPSGIVTTLTGGYGFSGDGGPASAAQITNPTVVAVDDNDNIYFVDEQNYRVRKIDTSGIISTYAGNGIFGSGSYVGVPATSTSITPEYITFDHIGNGYISVGSSVCKVDTAGILTPFAGGGMVGVYADSIPATSEWFSEIQSVAADKAGNIYIAADSRIRRVDSLGIIYTAALKSTWDFKFDKHGNIYLIDFGDEHISKIDTSGIITVIAGNGVMGFSGDGGPATAASIDGGAGFDYIALDSSGNVYITDNDRIREINFSPTAVPEINQETNEIRLYPNPATNNLFVTSTSRIKTLELVNPLGQILISQKPGTNNTSLDISILANGVYFVMVNGKAYKIVKE